jgi:hypothetical protein
MLCRRRRHSHGQRPGPRERVGGNGRLSVDYECGEATPNANGTWTLCGCLGWYRDLTAMQRTAETIARPAATRSRSRRRSCSRRPAQLQLS